MASYSRHHCLPLPSDPVGECGHIFILVLLKPEWKNGAVSIWEICTFKNSILGSDEFKKTKILKLEFTPNNSDEIAECQHIVAM